MSIDYIFASELDAQIRGMEIQTAVLRDFRDGKLPLVYSEVQGITLLLKVSRYGGKCLDALPFLRDDERAESLQQIADYVGRQNGEIEYLTYDEWVRYQDAGMRWCADIPASLGAIHSTHIMWDYRGSLHHEEGALLGILRDPTYDWEEEEE